MPWGGGGVSDVATRKQLNVLADSSTVNKLYEGAKKSDERKASVRSMLRSNSAADTAV